MGHPSEDRLAAQDVIVRYAASIDDRDFEQYRRCFHEDVELEGFGHETIRGIEAWLDFANQALAPYRATQHMLGVPWVRIEGDTARLRTDLQAIHFPKDRSGQIFTLWATYESRLVRTPAPEVWLIAHHCLVPRSHRFEPATS